MGLLPCGAFADRVPCHDNDPYFHSYTDGAGGAGGEDNGGHWDMEVGGDSGGNEDMGGDSYSYSCRHWGAVDVGAGHAWVDVA